MTNKFLTTIFSLFSFGLLIGQTIDAELLELVFSNNGYPERFTKAENGFYFTADDTEIWFTDGTVDGTRFFAKSAQSNGIGLILPVGNIVFFIEKKDIRTDELWVSDGTEEGTIQLTNRSLAFAQDGLIRNILALENKVFFSAYDETLGHEIWVSDGTLDGTFVLKDINSGEGDSSPFDFFDFNGKLIFKAYTVEFSTELWMSDGTSDGTVLLKDINEGNQGSVQNTYGYKSFDDNFYFFANDGVTGSELWKSNGTPEGTTLVKDVYEGNSNNSSTNNFYGGVLNGKLFFLADDGIHGTELWQTDGTSEGTSLFVDIVEGQFSSFGYPPQLIFSDSKAFFHVTDNFSRNELWVSDGTLAGTSFLKNTSVNNLTLNEFGESIFFFGDNGSNNKKILWKSDGTPQGTQVVSGKATSSNTSAHNNDIIALGGNAFFAAETERNGIELWVSDGTDGGTSLFYDLNSTFGANPSLLTTVGDQVYFRCNLYGVFGLCTSDGTIEGTKPLYVYPNGHYIDDESEFIAFDGKLVYIATDGIHGYEPWISDGTLEGTFMLKDINPGTVRGYDDSMVNFNSLESFSVIDGKLYFLAFDGTKVGLWVTDGTTHGTYEVTDSSVTASRGGNGSRTFTGFNDEVYFFGSGASGSGLYKIDPNSGENRFVHHFVAIEHLYATGSGLFVIQDNGGRTYPEEARELWFSNGTHQGTLFLQKLGNDRIDHAAIFKNDFYFSARIFDTANRALFRSDGTVEGTYTLYVGDIPVTMPLTNNLETCGEYLYFGLENSYGFMRQLWRTDGTVDGTIPIVDYLDNFVWISEKTCFRANLIFIQSDGSGRIWLTTGDPNEIYGLDVNVINGSSSLSTISHLTGAEHRVFYNGSTTISGTELYAAYLLRIGADNNLVDTDDDGVVDLFDECPGTLSHMEVNSVGCAENQLDDDNDGVTNNLDQCPNTLPNDAVDANGCSGADILDTDGDGVIDSLDLCPLTPIGDSVDENGCGQSELDDDEDGVMNDRDLCPGTLPIYTVDSEGCPILFELPSNNFSIETIGVTCVNRNNGQLLIAANENHNYVASINNDGYNFTTALTIQNLHAGKYELCITITDEPDFISCFGFEIADALAISGKSNSSILNQKLVENIEMFSGTPPYKVSVNGSQQLTTMSSSFSIEVNNGDLVQVTSKFPCEGFFAKKVEMTKGEVSFAPNPTVDDVYIYLPKNHPTNITVRIYNSNFQLVDSGLFEVSEGILKVSMESLSSGLYYIKIGTGNPIALKIMKK
ncbi:thrombospondin type 3 repeat-containing protein [Muricauda sp. SCSIO 64092]|uniref:T9SS type A sorting domain-containing protein n=1 Tax=Allomuricauda sp. SCSIO 64092 TaxID=2908842 RepID=UPI001FF64765|nr:T9SS type A sorting domain-containing protein [Muricauda sp. SCSIO 64092]UOY07187.1 thrombospondin type 3 repeat-containing protein [Muricauda sp. SCSIO 64092]